MASRINKTDILLKKQQGQKIVMLTAYDYPLAKMLDQCGVDMILIGDSLANVVLGLRNTRDIGMAEMLHHAKAVNRAVQKAMLIGDLPYEAYREPLSAVQNARRLMEEAGCDAVKIEWFEGCRDVVEALTKEGIPVISHVGLTPQTAEEFKVQGKTADRAKDIIKQTEQLEAWGCFCVVLECVPDRLAQMITGRLKIPTIGIGAGVHCDGQVLVSYDMLGMFDDYQPKFVKQYADIKKSVLEGVRQFMADVTASKYPDKEHSFTMSEDEWRKLAE